MKTNKLLSILILSLLCAVCCLFTTACKDEPTDISKFRYIVVNEEATITGYMGQAPKVLVIPDSINSFPVKKIGERAFSYDTNLTSVIIPDGVTCIIESAFEGCKNLTNLTIPNSVTEGIGASAFRKCNLKNLTIPDSVPSIGWGAFYGCNNLESVTLGNGVKRICLSAFEDCSNLRKVFISSSVTTIEDEAFRKCKKLCIYYEGSEEQWKTVKKGTHWDYDSYPLIIYNAKKPL